MDDLLDLHDLPLAEGHHQNVLFAAAVRAGGIEDGHAPVIGQNSIGDLLPVIRDDIGHFGSIQAVEHRIHDLAGHIQGHRAIESRFQPLKGDGRQCQYHTIRDQYQLAHGKPRKFQLQQAGHDVRTAGGSPLRKDDAQSRTHHSAAADGGQHGVHRGECIQKSDAVHRQ